MGRNRNSSSSGLESLTGREVSHGRILADPAGFNPISDFKAPPIWLSSGNPKMDQREPKRWKRSCSLKPL
ncbi:MAG: hypothetical protein D6785_10410 [Planctomycetota bacterium]|nr:MAG: hypothetical protein D6785_10410 [Planctomycetota bacterium]